jgi:hypothetical protein
MFSNEKLYLSYATIAIAHLAPLFASFYFAFDSLGWVGVAILVTTNAVSEIVKRNIGNLGKWATK